MEPPVIVDVPWTAARVGLPESTIRYWIHTQTELGTAFAKIGRRRLARRADVEKWLDAQFEALDGVA